jgi:hypothetical protein
MGGSADLGEKNLHGRGAQILACEEAQILEQMRRFKNSLGE